MRVISSFGGIGLVSVVVVLCACANLQVRTYQQAGLKVDSGRLSKIEAGVHFGGLRAKSTGAAMTRFKCQVGIDRSNPPDGQLTVPPDLITLDIDNTTSSSEVVVAEATITTNQPQNVIAHFEIYQGSQQTPVWSETWRTGDVPPFL